MRVFVTTGTIPNVVSESMIGSWLNGLDRCSRVSMMDWCWFGVGVGLASGKAKTIAGWTSLSVMTLSETLV